VPSFRKFEVMQRNLFIKSLKQASLSIAEIHLRVNSVFGEVSRKTVQRSANGN